MLLQAVNISKSYGTTTILSGISLQIGERERIGLVGVNGAGKSTLLQIISGEMSFDDGDIFKAKEVRVGYLAQNSGLQPGNTIYGEMRSVFAPLLEAEQELRDLESRMAEPDLLHDEAKYEETMNRYALRSEWFRERGGYEIESRIRSVLHGMGFAGFPPDTPVQTLSGGQKTRLALAKMLLEQPDLLMLDEPTNHLDIPTLTWLEGYLRGYPGAILVVSHDRFFLDALVTAIYEIERHTAKRYTGNYSRFIEIKAAEYEAQLKQYEKQQEDIARMEDFIRRNIVRATTTKRAQSRRKALERMDRLDKPLGDLKRASFSFQVEQLTGRDVLHAERLSVSYTTGEATGSMRAKAKPSEPDASGRLAETGAPGIARAESQSGGKLSEAGAPGTARAESQTGSKLSASDTPSSDSSARKSAAAPMPAPLFREVTFDLTRGETVALIGPNGVGKSSLLRLLVGEQPPTFGTFRWGSNVKLAYYDQEQTGLNPTNTVLQEVWNAYPHLEEVRIRTVLGSFLFSGDDVTKKVAALSGGEKARVALAKLMLLNANVLILDEPTNHLDLYSKEVLESALIDFEGTILFISHDRYFLNKMAERVFELSSTGVTTYLGNYDDYVEKKLELSEMNSTVDSPSGRPSGANPTTAGSGANLKAAASSAANPAAGKPPGGQPGSSGGTEIGSGSGSFQYEAEKQAKREERNRQRKLEQLEADIARLEQEIAALETELTEPDVYNDYLLVQEKQTAIDAKKSTLELIFAEWETLME